MTQDLNAEFDILQLLNEISNEQYKEFNQDTRELVSNASSLQEKCKEILLSLMNFVGRRDSIIITHLTKTVYKVEECIEMVEDLEIKVNNVDDISKEMEQYIARLGILIIFWHSVPSTAKELTHSFITTTLESYFSRR